MKYDERINVTDHDHTNVVCVFFLTEEKQTRIRLREEWTADARLQSYSRDMILYYVIYL